MFMMEFLAQQERNFNRKERIRRAKRLAWSCIAASVYVCSAVVIYHITTLFIEYLTR